MSSIGIKFSPFVVLSLIWLIALFIVQPLGDFPLNDDWAYAISVERWCKTGQFEIIDWPAMSLFTQIAWGTLWAKVFGFSFNILRLSTLVMAGLGIGVLNQLLRELNFRPLQRFLLLAVLVFNPLYFQLSLSFMTDVPFLSFCLFTTYCFWRIIREDKLQWWLWATLFSIGAILMRQLGILVPLAFAGALCIFRMNIRNILLSVLCIILTYGSLQVYLAWLDHTSGIPATFTGMTSIADRLNISYLKEAIQLFGGIYLIYIGLFLLPVLVALRLPLTRRSAIVTFVALIPVAYLVYLSWSRMPLGNMIFNLGVGPLTLPGTTEDKLAVFNNLGPNWLLFLKIIGAMMVFLLVRLFVYGLTMIKKHYPSRNLSRGSIFKLGVAFFILAYALFVVIDHHRFDRYLLTLVPFILLLFPAEKLQPKGGTFLFSGVGLFLLMLFTVMSSHDYLSWNKARWQALSSLEQQGIEATSIDGGFEYNGFRQTSHRNPENPYGKSWWFVAENEYSVAFGPYNNYSIENTFSFHHYLALRQDTVYLLKRPAWAEIDTIHHDFEKTEMAGDKNQVRFSILANRKKEAGIAEINHYYEMPAEELYSFNHQLFPVKPYEQISIAFRMKGNQHGFGVVNHAPDPEAFYYLHTPHRVKEEAGWQYITVEMTLPADYPSDTLDIYIWKQQAEAISIDDWQMIWKKLH